MAVATRNKRTAWCTFTSFIFLRAGAYVLETLPVEVNDILVWYALMHVPCVLNSHYNPILASISFNCWRVKIFHFIGSPFSFKVALCVRPIERTQRCRVVATPRKENPLHPTGSLHLGCAKSEKFSNY